MATVCEALLAFLKTQTLGKEVVIAVAQAGVGALHLHGAVDDRAQRCAAW